jgi:cyclic beta-1,2-glucan synthetase
MQELQRVRAVLLGNARYALLVTQHGGGFSAMEGLAITRWAPDPLGDPAGPLMYLRDLESGEAWPLIVQPGGRGSIALRANAATAQIASVHAGIFATLTIGAAGEAPLEVRHVKVENHSGRARLLELSTYAELVLNSPAADAGHPAFSKLFVQTDAPAPDTLSAWRRLRSPDDAPLHVAQRLVADFSTGRIEYETDRMRFLGRARGPGAPAALHCQSPLSGTIGNVLDPVFAQRLRFDLADGESAAAALLCAADGARATVLDHVGGVASATAALRLLHAVAGVPDVRTLGLPAGWRTGIDLVPTLEREVTFESAVPGHPREAVDAVPAAAAEAVNAAAPGQVRAAVTATAPPDQLEPAEDLLLFNGSGGFRADGREYVIRLRHELAADGRASLALPPLPWTNCIANEAVGCLVSERGIGCTWTANSRENRLTPWSNDPVTDPPAEALYLRDDESGDYWSPLPGPVPAPCDYEVRHGFGYSRFRSTHNELEQEATVFVPRDLPVRVVRLRFRNHAAQPRRFALYSYAQVVLGSLPQETRGRIAIERVESALLAWNPARAEYAGRVAFAAYVAEGDVAYSVTAERAAFLGPCGDVLAPSAVRHGGTFDNALGTPADACIAQRWAFEIPPGDSFECALLLGEAGDESAARAALAALRDVASVDTALEAVQRWWHELLGRVQVRTPAPAIDLMVNGWLAYQNLACRMWGRSAFYQSGGAFGFRDQLQDAAALLWLDPAITRAQIVLHAGHQFVEGDVLHWWHPPASKGIRTRFADDLLWLPLIASEYVRATGDATVLDEVTRYLRAEPLADGEDEVFVEPEESGERGSIYEHCCRAIDRSLAVGAHGLPLMGTGDWNDGMNRVGREGRGESVWMGFFLFDILQRFIPLVEARQEGGRARRYRAHAATLQEALNDGGWDGGWYRRAYYDSGAPLGAASNDECRIDTIAQAWAVLSGAAPPARAEQALDALEEHLVSEADGIIRLLTPAFDRTPHDPGYIKGYLPGVRENGGQYTHGALWAVRALAEAGRTERAARLLELLSPASHARTPAEVTRYQVEPYVVAADVYGVAPHVGRGGWTWYTGSAGWMYRVALESILGLELRADTLLLRPCIPRTWPGFEITLARPEATYHLEVRRGAHRSGGTIDGVPLEIRNGAVIVPLRAEGGSCRVDVQLGADVGRLYTPRTGR